jgi:signal transduction histidine kinase
MPDRRWSYYVAAWVPFAALWAGLVFRSRGSATFGVVAGVAMMGTAAALGPAVFAFTRATPVSDRLRPMFAVRHAVAALVFGVVMTLADAVLGGAYEGRSPIAFLAARRPDSGLWDLLIYSWLYGLLAAGSYVLHAHRRLRDREVAAARAAAEAAQAQVRALRAQLNPHFLFNALHSLSTLLRHDPPAAEQALDRLGALLRYALDDGCSEDVALDEEWRFTRDYLGLEALRLGDRLTVRQDVDPEALDCTVPSFCLQPLVENAIRHGIARRPSGGTLDIALHLRGEDLEMSVVDDGPGAERERAMHAPGFGLRALRERLAARFGGRGRLEIETTPGGGFTAVVRMPADGERTRDRVPA